MREAGNVIDTSGGEATGPHSCVHDGEEGTRGRGWGGGAVDERRRRTTRMHRGTLVDARRTMFGSAFPAGERPTPVTPADSLTTTNEQSKGEKKKRKRDTAKPAVGRTTVRIIARVEGGRGPSGRGARGDAPPWGRRDESPEGNPASPPDSSRPHTQPLGLSSPWMAFPSLPRLFRPAPRLDDNHPTGRWQREAEHRPGPLTRSS